MYEVSINKLDSAYPVPEDTLTQYFMNEGALIPGAELAKRVFGSARARLTLG